MAWWPKRAAGKRKVPDFLDVPWGLKDVVLFGAGWMLLQVAVVVAIQVLVAPFVPVVKQFLDAAFSGSDIRAVFALDLLDAGTGLGLVYWYLRHYKVGWSAVGWRKVSLGRAVMYLVVILVLFVVAANVVLMLVSWLVPTFNMNQAQDNEFTRTAGTHPSLAAVALVLMPPILEETIFRGFLFPAFAKRWGVVWGAIVSSAIFGLAHWQANISIYTFVLGLLLCFMYVRLRSIVPGMVLHMLNNYLALLAYTSK
jgi:membrane protease YdiL (CAAX protease family)